MQPNFVRSLQRGCTSPIRSVEALVVLDEAYMDFWDQSLLQEVEQYDNLIILRTCSKAFGMAAVRLGFAVANQTLTNAIRAVKSPYNVNSVTQAFGAAVLNQTEMIHEGTTQLIDARKELFLSMKTLEQQYGKSIYLYDSCTNFVFLKTPYAKEIYNYLLENSVAIRYMGDYLRVTAGAPQENEKVVQLFTQFLSQKGAE